MSRFRVNLDDFTNEMFSQYFTRWSNGSENKALIDDCVKPLTETREDDMDFVTELIAKGTEEITPFETFTLSLEIKANSSGDIAISLPSPFHTDSPFVLRTEAVLPLIELITQSYKTNKHLDFVSKSHYAAILKDIIKEESEIETRPEYGFVYLLASQTGYYKIGKSKDPSGRISTLGVQLPFAIEAEAVIECANRHIAERMLHDKYRNKRQGGEWFALTEEDVQYVTSIYFIDASGKPFERIY